MANFDFRVGLENFKSKLVVKSKKRLLILLGIVTAVVTFIAVYFCLMPINLSSGGFKFYLVLMALLWSTPLIFKSQKAGLRPRLKSPWGIPAWIALTLVIFIAVFAFAASPLFMAKNMRDLIPVSENGAFAEVVEDYRTMQIPVVDAGLAAKLGEKKLGEGNLGSQFQLDPEDYTMIKYRDRLCWIAPIEYRGFFQWTSKPASPGYVLISATDQSDVQIIRDELSYVESAYLWDDLQRKIYFSNMFRYREGKAHLELDENGHPYFVEGVLTRRYIFSGGLDNAGVIVTDAKTGDSKFYGRDEIPDWVDRAQPATLVTEQLGWWGRYVNGFFNSIFSKRDVLDVSTGVNYVYSNGDMYLQTGMTSVGNDESIVGVVMVNMRNKDTTFYRVAGATEYSAAQSAIGAEQAQRFTASDPLMINFHGIPTYFTMLKDDEGLVKRYAYVNVADYRIVATNVDRLAALNAYETMISPTSVTRDIELTIADIRSVVIDNNTCFYIRFADATIEGLPENFGSLIFKAPLSLGNPLIFLSAGDRVRVDLLLGSSENIVTKLTVV